MQQIFGQVAGVIATIITFVSYQANTKKSLLIIQTIATAFTALSYFLLGATSGFTLNIVCLIRNAFFYFQDDKSKVHTITSIILALIMAGVGILSWQDWMSLLIIVALATNTIFMSFGNPQLLRKSILLTSSMVLAYNIYVFSIGGIANEALAIISSIVGIIRFRKENNQPVLENTHDEEQNCEN